MSIEVIGVKISIKYESNQKTKDANTLFIKNQNY